MCSLADQLTQFILRKQIGFSIGQSMAILLDLDVVGSLDNPLILNSENNLLVEQLTRTLLINITNV